MFGGRPVILVKQAPQLTPALFEELLGAPLAAYIVIEAGNLKKDAKLRQLFEKAKNAAAIVCYGADSRSLQQLIREDVQKAGLTIAPDAAQRLGQLLGGDWGVSRAEIAKLALYAAGEPQITLEHVEAIVGDASAHAFDEALAAALAGDAAAALAQLDGLAAAGTPASVLLNVLERPSAKAARARRRHRPGRELRRRRRQAAPAAAFPPEGRDERASHALDRAEHRRRHRGRA